jgi:hypothetical protein
MPVDTGPKGSTKKLTKGMGLYGVQYLPGKAPDKSKPWAVVNLQTGDIGGRWHPDKASATDQQKAMYANMKNKARYGMAEAHAILAPLQFAEVEAELLWLEALPAKTWHTNEFGEVDVTTETLQRMVDNFYGNVRGQEIATDYDHGRDSAKGSKASGWIRQAEIRDKSLWLGIEPTETAKEELKKNEWKYFSLEWDDFVHPETEQRYQDVIYGGGFTNRPIAKGMVPINFSELFEVKPKQFAGKSPYGNVTYADPGYQKDGVKRYPLDTETHIRAAWSYINMPKNAAKYSSSQLASIKSKIKAAMSRIGATVQKKMSEDDIEKELNANLMPEEEATEVVEETKSEHVAEEHQEPGSENPDPTLNEDDSFPDRHVTLPADNDEDPTRTNKKEDEVPDKEVDAKLREILGIAEDGDIIKAAQDLKEKVGPLEEVANKFSEKKRFAEEFPEEAKELDRLRQEGINSRAIKFSEEVGSKRFNGDKGLSAKSLEKVANMHKAFSEGTAKIDDFIEVVNTIAGEGGMVDFQEAGSSRVNESDLHTPENGRVAFAEKVNQLMQSDSLEYGAAVVEASKRYPDLARAYAAPVMA